MSSVVAIHGLNGHRERTWTAANGKLWLRDLLPQRLPRAWGYDSNTHSSSLISAQYLHDHADTLVSDLCLERALTSVNASSKDQNKIEIAYKIVDPETPNNLYCAQSGWPSAKVCKYWYQIYVESVIFVLIIYNH